MVFAVAAHEPNVLMIGQILHAIRVLVHSEEAREACACEWTSDESNSHAYLFVPLSRVEAHVSSPKRLIQVVETLHLSVGVRTEYLFI